MPFYVGETINYLADRVLKTPLLRAAALNPIYTAFAITVVMMFIVMFVFRDSDTDEGLLVMVMRTGFWVFLSSLGLIFLHNKILTEECTNYNRERAYNSVFGRGEAGAEYKAPVANPLVGSIVPVQVNRDFTIA
jgi:hypothetical protein